MSLQYAKFKKVSLRNHPTLNEKWVQERIAEDPGILGLGDVILKDRERIQPRAGRLDLLLQEADTRRYEVEIQLGRTDESHIIRTVEYWDIERKRFPQYDHAAVIVAEDITSRFLNVISLFNGFIPLIAVQMSALQWENSVSLIFTTVLDQMTLGLEEDDEADVVDRDYWLRRGSKATVEMADRICAWVREFDQGLGLKYNKVYIGLAKEGNPRNFVVFRPQKSALRLEIKIAKSEEAEQKIEDAGLDLIDFDRWGRYRIRLSSGDVQKHEVFLKELLEQAYQESMG